MSDFLDKVTHPVRLIAAIGFLLGLWSLSAAVSFRSGYPQLFGIYSYNYLVYLLTNVFITLLLLALLGWLAGAGRLPNPQSFMPPLRWQRLSLIFVFSILFFAALFGAIAAPPELLNLARYFNPLALATAGVLWVVILMAEDLPHQPSNPPHPTLDRLYAWCCQSPNDLIVTAFFSAGLTGLLFLPVLFQPNLLLGSLDIIDYHFFNQLINWRAFHGGQLPWWNPHLYSGMPHIANFQSLYIYPPHFLLNLFLPPNTTITLSLVGHLWLGALTTYLLARDFSLKPPFALVTDTALILSGALLVRVLAGHINLIYPMVWFPLAWLAVRKLIRQLALGPWVLLALSIGLILLTGHPTIPAYILLFLAGYTALGLGGLKGRGNQRRIKLGIISLAIFTGIALSAIQLVPSLVWATQTELSTGYDDLFLYLLGIRYWPQVLGLLIPGAPNLFHIDRLAYFYFWEWNIFHLPVIFLLAILGATTPRSYPNQNTLLLLATLFCILFAATYPNGLSTILYDLQPLLKTLRIPSRILLVANLFIVILAGFGLQSLLSNAIADNPPNRHQQLWFMRQALLTIGCFCLGICSPLWLQTHPLPSDFFLTAHPLFSLPYSQEILASFIFAAIATGLLLITLVFTTIFNAPPVIYLAFALSGGLISLLYITPTPELAWRATIVTFSVFGAGLLLSRFAITKHLKLTTLLWPLYIGLTLLLIGRGLINPIPVTTMREGSPATFIPTTQRVFDTYCDTIANRAVQTQHQSIFGYDPARLVGPAKVMDAYLFAKHLNPTPTPAEIQLARVMGVAYFCTANPIEDTNLSLHSVKYRPDGYANYWYAIPNPVPQVYWVNQTITIDDLDATVAALQHEKFDPLTMVILEEPLHLPAANAPTTQIAFTPGPPYSGALHITSQTAVDGLLVINETFYSEREITLNGQPAEILRANAAYMAVYLPAGEHTLTLEYVPRSYQLGARISLSVLGLLACLFVANAIRRQWPRPGQKNIL